MSIIINNSITTIKLSKIIKLDNCNANAELEALAAACVEHGCFYLEVDGSADELIKNSIQEARLFFDMKLEDKLQCNSNISKIGRGYHGLEKNGFSTENSFDIKESFYAGVDIPDTDSRVIAGWPNHGSNLWPDANKAPLFRFSIERHLFLSNCISEILMAAFSRYFHDERLLLVKNRGSMSFIRALNYPISAGTNEMISFHAHTDRGFLSIVAQDNSYGLQVNLKGNGWVNAGSRKSCMFINIGELFSYYTSGFFTACEHRVISSKSVQSRVSLVYFYEPPYDELVCPISNVKTKKSFESIAAGNFIYGNYLTTAI